MLTLRSDLIFTPELNGNKPGYVIEDPVNTKFYRIGIAEYKFISLLDGATSVAEAVRSTAVTLSDQAFTQDEAATICKWLVDVGLAHTAESARPGRLVAAAQDADRTNLWQRLNPMYLRLPLVQPDRLLDCLTPWLGWLHGPLGWTLAATAGIVGLCHLMVDWDRFLGDADGICAPSRWLWLGTSWLLLKVVHETSHGIVCRRYGGSVREGGITFVLFAPLAYVDVTSSWRFPSKWQRIHTAAAGMYSELLIASLAVIVWSRTEPGMLRDASFNVVIMASLTTLVFNANPLMRFDGYYILSDLLAIPNLYPNGQQYLRYLGRRYLLGVPDTPPRWTKGRDGVVKLYGLAAFVWRITVCAALVIAASTMFAGAGIVVAAVAIVLWLGPGLTRLVKMVRTDPLLTRGNGLRLLATTAGILALGTLLFTLIPWPGVVRAPAIIQYSPMAVVRAGSPGFVKKLMVHDGQVVQEGHVLAVLDNDDLRTELADIKLQVEDSRILCRSLMEDDHMAAYQAELKRCESLEAQSAQKQEQVDQLTVRAPITGQVIGRRLDSLLGTYLTQGAPLLCIGNRNTKELQISVGQDDLEAFTRRLKRPVMIRLAGVRRFTSTLIKVSPRASIEPLHEALCSPNGGPLAVRPTPGDSDTSDGEGEAEGYQLLAPRFLAVVALRPRESSLLLAGQRGVASFWDENDTVGQHVCRSIDQWIRKKIARAKWGSRQRK